MHRLAVTCERAHAWPCAGGEAIGDGDGMGSGGAHREAGRRAGRGGVPCAWLDWRSFQEAELERRFRGHGWAGPPWADALAG